MLYIGGVESWDISKILDWPKGVLEAIAQFNTFLYIDRNAPTFRLDTLHVVFCPFFHLKSYWFSS